MARPQYVGPILMQDAATATGNGTSVACVDTSSGTMMQLMVQISGISGDTITFEGTVGGTIWDDITATFRADEVMAATATVDGIYMINCLALAAVRARISTYSAGTITAVALGVE